MKEKVLVDFTLYRDASGQPTCAANFETGDICENYRTTHFGTRERCCFDEGQMLKRRGSCGTLIPGDWCPLLSRGFPAA